MPVHYNRREENEIQTLPGPEKIIWKRNLAGTSWNLQINVKPGTRIIKEN